MRPSMHICSNLRKVIHELACWAFFTSHLLLTMGCDWNSEGSVAKSQPNSGLGHLVGSPPCPHLAPVEQSRGHSWTLVSAWRHQTLWKQSKQRIGFPPSAIGTQRPGRGSHVRKHNCRQITAQQKIKMTGDKRIHHTGHCYYVHFSQTCAISARAGCSAMARSSKFKKCAAGRFPWLY